MKKYNRQKIVLFLIKIFHLGDCEVWRQNGLNTIVELNFFNAPKTKGMATIWRSERVAAITVCQTEVPKMTKICFFFHSGGG